MKKLVLFFLLVNLSCSKKQENKQIQLKNKSIEFFDPITLGATGVDANLKIGAF